MTTPFQIEGLEADGFARITELVEPSTVCAAMDELDAHRQRDDRRRGGVRNALVRFAALNAIAAHPRVRECVRAVLGREPALTRAILFDKRPDANWDLAWHQDTTIAVRGRIDTPGFGPWSVKEGVVHVLPPAHVLEPMITARINLDDCDERNGPLLVLPGTHCAGIWSEEHIRVIVATRAHEAVTCTGCAGDAVLMRPLLLHASRKAESPRHRRILHLEFAGGELPNGLEWARADA